MAAEPALSHCIEGEALLLPGCPLGERGQRTLFLLTTSVLVMVTRQVEEEGETGEGEDEMYTELQP